LKYKSEGLVTGSEFETETPPSGIKIGDANHFPVIYEYIVFRSSYIQINCIKTVAFYSLSSEEASTCISALNCNLVLIRNNLHTWPQLYLFQ
jgi:hypothetical protein